MYFLKINTMDALKKEVAELKAELSDTKLEVSTLRTDVTKLTADNKKLAKQLKKLLKEAEPEDKPKRVNGFAKPMKMSAELCKFLGVSETTEMARTDVTKAITAYVKEHNLQNPDNKRELILDDKLKQIIQPEDDVTVTFFNLQKFMSKHYVKSAATPAEAKPASKGKKAVAPATPPATPEPAAVDGTKVKRVFKKKA